MKINLRVTVERGPNNEEILSSSLEVDDKEILGDKA
jgi:hypothetical protein